MLKADAQVQAIMRQIFVDPRAVARDQYNATRAETGGSNGPWKDDGESPVPEGIFLPDGSPFRPDSAAAVSRRSKVTA